MAHNHNHRHRVLVSNARNPLRVDPTRTTLIRERFQAEVRRRFGKLRRAVINFMVTLDALGLAERSKPVFMGEGYVDAYPLQKTPDWGDLGARRVLVSNVQPREYEFRTSAGKLSAFNDWFRQQMDADILAPVAAEGAGWTGPWTTKYVESAYRRGSLNAYMATNQNKFLQDAGVGEMGQEQFLRSAFSQPERLSKIQLLGMRSWEGMKGITASMGSEMNRILAQGMADGKNPRAIAKEMTKKIDGMTRTRALVIARTEVIHAHAEGQLDTFAELGIDELGVMAEWSTAGDDRVCEQCASLEGQTFDLKEARGMIPLHPNCRCSWIPSEEQPKKKKRKR